MNETSAATHHPTSNRATTATTMPAPPPRLRSGAAGRRELAGGESADEVERVAQMRHSPLVSPCGQSVAVTRRTWGDPRREVTRPGGYLNLADQETAA